MSRGSLTLLGLLLLAAAHVSEGGRLIGRRLRVQGGSTQQGGTVNCTQLYDCFEVSVPDICGTDNATVPALDADLSLGNAICITRVPCGEAYASKGSEPLSHACPGDVGGLGTNALWGADLEFTMKEDWEPGTPNATICSYAQRVSYTPAPDATTKTLYHATFYVKDKTCAGDLDGPRSMDLPTGAEGALQARCFPRFAPPSTTPFPAPAVTDSAVPEYKCAGDSSECVYEFFYEPPPCRTSSDTNTPTDTEPVVISSETAYAYQLMTKDGIAVDTTVPFCGMQSSSKGPSRWGWFFELGMLSDSLTVDAQLVAGAGQCNLTKGTPVGNLELQLVRNGDAVLVSATRFDSRTDQAGVAYRLSALHIWLGPSLPTDLAANGKFPVNPSPEAFPKLQASNAFVQVFGDAGFTTVRTVPEDKPAYLIIHAVAEGIAVWP